MTSEEWRVQGIEFALSAEGDAAEQFLEKAIKCFVQAGDAELLQRAVAEAEMVRVRELLGKHHHSKLLSEQLEKEVAKTVASVLRCGLVAEARELCGTLRNVLLDYVDLMILEVMCKM